MFEKLKKQLICEINVRKNMQFGSMYKFILNELNNNSRLTDAFFLSEGWTSYEIKDLKKQFKIYQNKLSKNNKTSV